MGHTWTHNAKDDTFLWSCDTPASNATDPLQTLAHAVVSKDGLVVAGRRFYTWGMYMDALPQGTTVERAFGSCILEMREPLGGGGGIVYSEKEKASLDTKETRKTCRAAEKPSQDFKKELFEWTEGRFNLKNDILLDYGDFSGPLVTLWQHQFMHLPND